jgi:hypothetical protein
MCEVGCGFAFPCKVAILFIELDGSDLALFFFSHLSILVSVLLDYELFVVGWMILQSLLSASMDPVGSKRVDRTCQGKMCWTSVC